MNKPDSLKKDATYRYVLNSGMLERGWIGWQRLIKAVALKRAINEIKMARPYKEALHLALVTEVINTASNIRFGPELYCGKPRKDVDLLANFEERVKVMSRDLGIVRDMASGTARVLRGDARLCSKMLKRRGYRRFHAVICSPPYPAEHDYTRNSRLELAFLEVVSDRQSLQKIKKGMIRSHTKGVYEGDSDGLFVAYSNAIDRIATKIRKKIKNKRHGFARLYPKVLMEYFGGMTRHFQDVKKILAPGAHCAYVVGDQSSYLRVHIPTARILGELAREAGFRNVRTIRWRSRWSTTTSRNIDENILVFQAPGKN
jgi:hypothetical protein